VDEQGDLDSVVGVKLAQNGRDVGFDGRDAEKDAGGDLGVGQPLADGVGDFEFSFGEGSEAFPGRVAARRGGGDGGDELPEYRRGQLRIAGRASSSRCSSTPPTTSPSDPGLIPGDEAS
jgi:hypothetical protein